MIRLQNVKIPIEASDADVRRQAARMLRLPPEKIVSVRLLRRSVDARHKPELHFVMTLALEVKGDENAVLRHARCRDAASYDPPHPFVVPKLQRRPEHRPVVCGAGPAGLFAALTLAEAGAEPLILERGPATRRPAHRPVVCGAGPAGLFAALTLAEAGAEPLILERGPDARRRLAAVARFHAERKIDPDANVQFGEGGAGTFSDGKLTTNISDPRCAQVLQAFVEAGAPEEILWQAKPHIGTDLLPDVIGNIRRRILAAGGEVRFETRLSDILTEAGKLRAVVAEKAGARETIDADALILAAGHSARDIFELLLRRGAELAQKPFSVGVRIEHPQRVIDLAQYGRVSVPALGAADYKLSCHLADGRSVYTFCMCPGGEVVAAASEAEGLVVNGMSRFARDGENANSALLVNVTPDDFGSPHPLAGVEFQRHFERAAYAAGGRDFTAPAQLLGDFLQGTPSAAPGSVRPSYPLGVKFGDLSDVLPDFAVRSMREAVPVFDARLRGFALPDAVLTGVETRSSSPVRILRRDDGQSNLRGVFPCGEGAGYAGGIMSAAVDGIRIAQAVLRELE